MSRSAVFVKPVRIILPAIIMSLCACQAPTTRSPSTGTVRAILAHEPNTLSLIGKTDRYSEVIARQVTDSLVQFDSSLHYAPRLAVSWDLTLTDTGMEVVFHLRDGVRWHDGSPFTAADVEFTIMKVRDPATEARSFLSQFQDLQHLEVLDDLTVKAVYGKPYADFMEAWTVPIIPKHLAEKDEDILTGEYSRHPVGCGPFRFVSHTPGERIVLEANQDYWDGPPLLERLIFRIVPEERTGYQSVLSGEIDIMAMASDLWRESKTEPRAANLGRFIYPRLNIWYIAWNQKGNVFFDNAGTRRAMMHALDRRTFIEQVLDGLAIPGATAYHPASPWADRSVEPYRYDPAEATRLLQAAGWSDGDGDGVLDRDGRPFSFTLTYPRGSQEIAGRMAAWIQQSLAEVGVVMEIEQLEWRAFLERRKNRDYHAAMSSMSFSPVPDLYELFHSSAMDGGFNFFGLDDPEIDRLVEAGRVTLDHEERLEIYRALQHRLHQLEPLGCLFHFSHPVLHSPGLKGVEPTPIDFWRIYPGPRAWYWEDGIAAR